MDHDGAPAVVVPVCQQDHGLARLWEGKSTLEQGKTLRSSSLIRNAYCPVHTPYVCA